MPLSAAQLDVLTRNPWFAGLPEALRSSILQRAQLRHLSDGETLFLRSDSGAAWYGVLAGAIKAIQAVLSISGNPASFMVGMSGVS